MKRKNPLRTLLDELRKDAEKKGSVSPEEARRRARVAAGFRRLNAWKKKAARSPSARASA
jgi:hypothetical protein